LNKKGLPSIKKIVNAHLLEIDLEEAINKKWINKEK